MGDCGIKERREQEVCNTLGPTNFSLESGKIVPTCPASSEDGADHECHDNDKGDKESDGDKEYLYLFDILDFHIIGIV